MLNNSNYIINSNSKTDDDNVKKDSSYKIKNVDYKNNVNNVNTNTRI